MKYGRYIGSGGEFLTDGSAEHWVAQFERLQKTIPSGGGNVGRIALHHITPFIEPRVGMQQIGRREHLVSILLQVSQSRPW
jgi:hypothetical protein